MVFCMPGTEQNTGMLCSALVVPTQMFIARGEQKCLALQEVKPRPFIQCLKLGSCVGLFHLAGSRFQNQRKGCEQFGWVFFCVFSPEKINSLSPWDIAHEGQ